MTVTSRYSGLEVPCFLAKAIEIRSLVKAVKTEPDRHPAPIPIYASPWIPTENPYCSANTEGKVAKRRYKKAKTIAI